MQNASKIINKSKYIQQCRLKHQGEIDVVFEITSAIFSLMSAVELDDSIDLSFVKGYINSNILFRIAF